MRYVKLILILTMCFTPGLCRAQQQNPDPIYNEFKENVEREVIKLRQELQSGEYYSDYIKNLTISFKIDTFRIERWFAKRLSADFTTMGMVKATTDLEAGYDALLNKYYQILISKLNLEDQTLFQQSQRNWLKYRDSERIFNLEISKEQYSGGGTIQRLNVVSRYQDITKQRVLEIYYYLTRLAD